MKGLIECQCMLTRRHSKVVSTSSSLTDCIKSPGPCTLTEGRQEERKETRRTGTSPPVGAPVRTNNQTTYNERGIEGEEVADVGVRKPVILAARKEPEEGCRVRDVQGLLAGTSG